MNSFVRRSLPGKRDDYRRDLGGMRPVCEVVMPLEYLHARVRDGRRTFPRDLR